MSINYSSIVSHLMCNVFRKLSVLRSLNHYFRTQFVMDSDSDSSLEDVNLEQVPIQMFSNLDPYR